MSIVAEVKVVVDKRLTDRMDEAKRKAHLWGRCQEAAMSAYQDLKGATSPEHKPLPESNGS